MRMCWTGTLGWICMHTITVTPVRRIVILLVIGEEVAVARGPYEMGKGAILVFYDCFSLKMNAAAVLLWKTMLETSKTINIAI